MNGLAGPTTGLPARRPMSIRRTSSLDLLPTPKGGLELRGRARDLRTGAHRRSTVIDHAQIRVVVGDDFVVREASGYPSDPTALIGRKVTVGFRTAVWRHLRPDYDARTPLHLLLDDIPGGMVISGFSARTTPSDATPRRSIDVCIGWASDSDAARRLSTDGRTPPPDWNPIAPSWSVVPGEFHTLAPLPVSGMRRARRLDVWRDSGVINADVSFRDTFIDRHGTERILHEYSASVGVDADGVVNRCDAVPRVLPHLECPEAAVSSQRVVGRPVDRLRESVSMDFFGPTTCTHLNDVLRGLTDLPALAAALGSDTDG